MISMLSWRLLSGFQQRYSRCHRLRHSCNCRIRSCSLAKLLFYDQNSESHSESSRPTDVYPLYFASPPLSTKQRQDLTTQKMEGMALHLADARILLKNRKKYGPPISNAAFHRVKFGATTFEVSSRGVIDTLCHGLKDITVEDFKYVSTGVAFHEASCGSGPAAEKRIQALIRGLGAEHFVESPLDSIKCVNKVCGGKFDQGRGGEASGRSHTWRNLGIPLPFALLHIKSCNLF